MFKLNIENVQYRSVKKIQFIILLLLSLFLLSGCGENFYNVVPVTHEYEDYHSFLTGLENLKLKAKDLDPIYYYIFEFEEEVDVVYYIKSVTTTSNAETSTKEFPKMSYRGFEIGFQLIIDGNEHNGKFSLYSQNPSWMTQNDYDNTDFINEYAVSIKDFIDQHTKNLTLIEIIPID